MKNKFPINVKRKIISQITILRASIPFKTIEMMQNLNIKRLRLTI